MRPCPPPRGGKKLRVRNAVLPTKREIPAGTFRQNAQNRKDHCKMKNYAELTTEERARELSALRESYAAFKARGLSLDMSRGKPSPEQLDLSSPIQSDAEYRSLDGVDCRNYGELAGLREMRCLFGEMLGVPWQQVVVGGNSSLKLMYDMIARAYTHGLVGSKKPWAKYDVIKFICPSPGYDRHFAVTQYFGAQLILVPMLETGPDMGEVERIVKDDETVKGIWCVPVYSNPTGCVYSAETVKRLAAMKCAADDFTVMWDNAYCVHDLFGESADIPEMLSLCAEHGHPNRVFEFASTSKITFSGAGVACVASSPENIEYLKKSMFYETIGYDKLNQLVHARFLKDMATLRAHMAAQAEIIRPKFLIVDRILKRELEGLAVASWRLPRGGYFINLVTNDGCAGRVVALCAEAGVKLTGAGAAFPYGVDPDDRNIRLAPSYPSEEDLAAATELLSICVKIASLEKLEGTRA